MDGRYSHIRKRGPWSCVYTIHLWIFTRPVHCYKKTKYRPANLFSPCLWYYWHHIIPKNCNEHCSYYFPQCSFIQSVQAREFIKTDKHLCLLLNGTVSDLPCFATLEVLIMPGVLSVCLCAYISKWSWHLASFKLVQQFEGEAFSPPPLFDLVLFCFFYHLMYGSPFPSHMHCCLAENIETVQRMCMCVYNLRLYFCLGEVAVLHLYLIWKPLGSTALKSNIIRNQSQFLIVNWLRLLTVLSVS